MSNRIGGGRSSNYIVTLTNDKDGISQFEKLREEYHKRGIYLRVYYRLGENSPHRGLYKGVRKPAYTQNGKTFYYTDRARHINAKHGARFDVYTRCDSPAFMK